MESNNGEAKSRSEELVSRVDISIVTALIKLGSFFYHYSHQGPEVTLITANAEGIEGGKTTIKSRSVDVGVVESATLADDLTHVEINKARLNSGMENCCIKIPSFGWWKPQIGREGLAARERCCLGFISNCSQSAKGKMDKYDLLDSLHRYPA